MDNVYEAALGRTSMRKMGIQLQMDMEESLQNTESNMRKIMKENNEKVAKELEELNRQMEEVKTLLEPKANPADILWNNLQREELGQEHQETATETDRLQARQSWQMPVSPKPRREARESGKPTVEAQLEETQNEETQETSVYEIVEQFEDTQHQEPKTERKATETKAATSQEEKLKGNKAGKREPESGQPDRDSRKLYITPTDDKTTLEDLRKTLENLPQHPEVRVQAILGRRDHLEVLCQDAESAKTLHTHLKQQRKLIDRVEITQQRDKVEELIIKNMPQNSTRETLIAALDIRKEALSEAIEVQTKRTSRDRTTQTWKVSVPRKLVNYLTTSTFFIGMREIKCEKFLQLQRCKNCQDFGHLTTECHRRPSCLHCAYKHRSEDCEEREKTCVNCWNSNKQRGTEFDTRHKASDAGCPFFKELKQRLNQSSRASSQRTPIRETPRAKWTPNRASSKGTFKQQPKTRKTTKENNDQHQPQRNTRVRNHNYSTRGVLPLATYV